MKILNQPSTTLLDFKQFVAPDAFTQIDSNATIDGISDAVKLEWYKSVLDHVLQGGTVTDDQGNDITEEVLNAMANEDYYENNEKLVTEFYMRALQYKPSYETSFLTDNIVPLQHSLDLVNSKHPELKNYQPPTDVSDLPTQAAKSQATNTVQNINMVAYTDSDMCVAAGQAIKYNDIRPLEVTIAALYNPEALCINVSDDGDWSAMATKCFNEAKQLHSMGAIDDPTMLILSQIFNAKMEADTLTLAIPLRSNVTPNTTPGCFGRVLMHLLQTEKDRFMPTSLRNFWYPRNIIFVNDYAHEHATPAEISDEWRHIMKECRKFSTPVAINELRKLDKSHNGDGIKKCGHDHDVNAVQIDFKTGVPKVPQLYKRIKKLVEQKSNDEISAHPYVDKRLTFARASRTRPDDFNKKGQVRKISYYKDLHLYCDCSGSVSFENLQNTIIAAIKVAKKLDLDLYLTTWGSSISQATRVPILNHTDKQIINFIVNLPMCGGGTNADLVWERCTATKKRIGEIAIMITDFCFSTPRFDEMPKNLCYMPLIPTKGDMQSYKQICDEANTLMRNLSKIYSVPVAKVRKRFLF